MSKQIDDSAPFVWPFETKDGEVILGTNGQPKPDLRKKTLYGIVRECRRSDPDRMDEILAELERVSNPQKQGKKTTAIDPAIMALAIEKTPAFGKPTQYLSLLGSRYLDLLVEAGHSPMLPSPVTIVAWSLATNRTLRVQPSDALIRQAKAG